MNKQQQPRCKNHAQEREFHLLAPSAARIRPSRTRITKAVDQCLRRDSIRPMIRRQSTLDQGRISEVNRASRQRGNCSSAKRRPWVRAGVIPRLMGSNKSPGGMRGIRNPAGTCPLPVGIAPGCRVRCALRKTAVNVSTAPRSTGQRLPRTADWDHSVGAFGTNHQGRTAAAVTSSAHGQTIPAGEKWPEPPALGRDNRKRNRPTNKAVATALQGRSVCNAASPGSRCVDSLRLQ